MLDLKSLALELENELRNDIIPFWINNMVSPSGHLYGRRDGANKLVPGSDKSCILVARILWTYAEAYRLTGLEECQRMASIAKDEIVDFFLDKDYGGAFWSVDANGRPVDMKKQVYSMAFTIYALSKMYEVSGDKACLDAAIRLYEAIEAHSNDGDGYLEAFTRQWEPIEDMRLSDKDQNDAKTMNTHLHLLEAYTLLYKVWGDEAMGAKLRGLIDIFTGRIVLDDGHMGLFFNEQWQLTSSARSYGHDIEFSWLLCEAAEVLGDEALVENMKAFSQKVAKAAMEGLAEDGAMIYEYDPASGERDGDKHWWVQAEAVVGLVGQYQITGDTAYLDAAWKCWKFVKDRLLAPDGEWYWSICEDGSVNVKDDRAGFWKCPYHNGRMCMEVMRRAR